MQITQELYVDLLLSENNLGNGLDVTLHLSGNLHLGVVLAIIEQYLLHVHPLAHVRVLHDEIGIVHADSHPTGSGDELGRGYRALGEGRIEETHRGETDIVRGVQLILEFRGELRRQSREDRSVVRSTHGVGHHARCFDERSPDRCHHLHLGGVRGQQMAQLIVLWRAHHKDTSEHFRILCSSEVGDATTNIMTDQEDLHLLGKNRLN
mmetsp:Transcript_25825/g.64871  ORF Transcript_25825/g.64871 Transcript_25825/m.64871 type:complete len:208 (-) Transcript_25825:419-1042(-)